MAFCIVDGTTVPVALGGGSLKDHPVGDKHRAFDGTMRSTITDHLREWKVRSAPMLSTAANALYTSLVSLTQPKTCSGDLLGASIACHTTFESKTSVVASSTSAQRWIMEFTLEEAS